MKKFILILMMFVTSSMFGYYTTDGFIDFLVDTNQFRARLDRVGFKLAVNNFHIAAGLTGANGGLLLQSSKENPFLEEGTNTIVFQPNAIVGFGYKTPIIGVGVGYQFNYTEDYQIHTPLFTMYALDNDIRFNIPIDIGVGARKLENQMGISTAPEFRYYFNLPFLSHIRVYGRYGQYEDKNFSDVKSSSFGLAARIYFKAELENIVIEPIIRINYDQAIKGYNFDVTAQNRSSIGGIDSYSGTYSDDLSLIKSTYGVAILEPYRVGISLPVGFSAGNDFIWIYLEPAISFSMIGGKDMYESNQNSPVLVKKRSDPFYSIAYIMYGEFYMHPTPALEWYTEIQTGGVSVGGFTRNAGKTEMVFNASTGLTWYFNLPN
ncbi:cell surface protein [Brachyspira intermedia]|uniref:cell surface protein n=1 Tax=Brachyspira intermedia TaxID=84377 RepID=UPI00300650E7